MLKGVCATRRLWVAALVLAVSATSAMAAYDLQITEIWPGNEPGSNLSEDWFEVTNYGDTAWTAAVDGDLYFDDDSADPVDAALMSGIASIAPGDTVIFVDDGALGAADWITLWSPDLASVPPVGSYAGKGLGQGGDGVTVFVDDLAVGVNLTVLDFELYPDATLFGGRSYDVPLSAFSTVGNAAGAIATTSLNDEFQPAIGSPGSVVPEPATIALLVAGSLVALRRRR